MRSSKYESYSIGIDTTCNENRVVLKMYVVLGIK